MASSNFIDYVKICCRSGAGGNGSVHFRREKFVAFGGPDGGDGGRGGHVILRGNAQLWTLLHLKYKKHVMASDGSGGGASGSSGREGQDVILDVPLGTIARDPETGEKIIEVVEDGQEVVLVKGGFGGKGNSHYKTATNQTPRYAQEGGKSITDWVVLELKVLADVGLVGLPNAGKSTLLSVISAAKPEIGDYAFTTIVPNLGVVPYRDYRSFIMADIPGIIEGASEGKGLGTRFLRHIERNSVLLFMISADSDDIISEYMMLLTELEKHNIELLDKRRMLAITKADLLDDIMIEQMKEELPEDIDTYFISSLAHQGLMEIKDAIWKLINEKIED